MLGLINERLPDDRPVLTAEPTGTIEAIGKNVMGGFTDLGGFGTMVVAGAEELAGKAAGLIGWDEGERIAQHEAQNLYKFYEEAIKPAKDFWSVDPTTTSMSGQILGGIARMAPLFLFGELAGPLMVAETTMNTAVDLADQGLDAKKAVGMGLLSGLTMVPMVRLPMAGKNIWQTAGLIAANPIMGAASREMSKEVLQSWNRPDLAEMYDPFDPAAMSIDIAMGLFFGALGHMGLRNAKQHFEGEKAVAMAVLERKLTSSKYRDYLDSLPIEAEDAMGTIRQFQKNIKDTPFDTKDAGAIRVHLDALDKALADITADHPISIDTDMQKAFQDIITKQSEKLPVDYRTGEALKTPDEVLTALKDMQTAQKRREYLLKSGDDMVREAKKEGIETFEYQNRLKEEQASAVEHIQKLSDLTQSTEFKLWQAALKGDTKATLADIKKEPTPADIERIHAKELVREEAKRIAPEMDAESPIPQEITVTEDWGVGPTISKKGEAIARRMQEGKKDPGQAGMTKKKTAAAMSGKKSIISWVETKGKINYQKEKFKGEIDTLIEGNGRIKGIVDKKGRGLTLDELALMAKDEGFIKDATPDALLEAIGENRMRPDIAEAGRDFDKEHAEYQERKRLLGDNAAEEIVERHLAENGDFADDHKEGETYTSTREEIDRLRGEVEKVESIKDTFDDIILCIRQGG